MEKQRFITPSELARICTENGNPLTRQAVHKAMLSGIIPYSNRGGKKYIDLENPAIQEYIHGTNRQREQVKRTSEKHTKSAPPSKKPTGKPAKPGSASEMENLDPHEMNRRAKFAEMRKKELQVLVMEKKYLPVDFIDAVYIKHLENFHSLMERTAGTYIQDIGKKILESGEVLPEHIEKFTSLILEAIHNNKKQTRKFVNDYEPHL